MTKPLARNSDPWTSHAAGEVVRPHLGKIQELVLEVFDARGAMTARDAETLPEFAPYGFSTIRKRISELAVAGRLVSVGVDCTGRAPCTIYAVPYFFREPVMQAWSHSPKPKTRRTMNVTLTIQADNEHEAARLARVLSAFTEMLPETKVAPSPVAGAEPVEPIETAKEKKAAQAKARRAKKKEAEEAAKKAESDLIGEPDAEVTLDELKAAVRECVDAKGVDAVKAIFEEHGAEKLSGLSAADYADVLAALNDRG